MRKKRTSTFNKIKKKRLRKVLLARLRVLSQNDSALCRVTLVRRMFCDDATRCVIDDVFCDNATPLCVKLCYADDMFCDTAKTLFSNVELNQFKILRFHCLAQTFQI